MPRRIVVSLRRPRRRPARREDRSSVAPRETVRGQIGGVPLRHASGAASSVSLSLTAPAGISETVFWGSDGLVRVPGEVDVTAAYAAALAALAAGSTPFDARFGLKVVRVLAAAEAKLSPAVSTLVAPSVCHHALCDPRGPVR